MGLQMDCKDSIYVVSSLPVSCLKLYFRTFYYQVHGQVINVKLADIVVSPLHLVKVQRSCDISNLEHGKYKFHGDEH